MRKSSSSSSAGVIFLLLVVAGGLGYFSYLQYQSIQKLQLEVQELDQSIQELQNKTSRSYYRNNTDQFSFEHENYYQIPDLNLTVDVRNGEKIYVMFTCTAYITQDTALNYMYFYLAINNQLIYPSSVRVGSTGTVNPTEFSVALQYANDTLTAGQYVIGVYVYREGNGYVENSALMVSVSPNLIR